MEKRTYALLYDVEDTHWWFVTRRKLLKALLARYSRSSAKVLEIGCGTAATLSMLKKDGYQVEGLDMSPEAATFASERGIPVSIGGAEALPYPDEEFDTVLLLDVIEHIETDAEALREARRVLRPGGLIVIFTPAYMWMWGRQDRISHHKRRYTASLLQSRIPDGMTILKLSYFNTFLFPLIAGTRFIVETLSLPLPDENRMNSPVLNKLFTKIFGAEVPFLKRHTFPFGVSLLVVAQKTDTV